MESEGQNPSLCLICSSAVIKKSSVLKSGHVFCDNSEKLPIIFILGSILEIPVNKLKYYLGECGSFSDWAIKLCAKCNESVNKTKLIYDEIQDAMRSYGQAKEEIIQKIKSSVKASTERTKKKGADIKGLDNITVSSREFVRSHEYGRFTYPFHTKELEELKQLTSALMEVAEVKTEPMDDSNGEDDDQLKEEILPKVELMEGEEFEWEGSSESDLEYEEEEDDPGNLPEKLDEDDPFAPKAASNVAARRNRAARHAIDESKSRPDNFICLCGSAFAKLKSLSLHIRYFTEEPKFKCELCPKKLFSLNKLKAHMIQVHMTKYYAEGTSGCIDCGAVFTDTEAHKLHRRLEHPNRKDPRTTPHGEDKINASDGSLRCLCGKGFESRADRLKHIQRHRAVYDYKFKCNKCKSRFRSTASLESHVAKFHKEAKDTRQVGGMSCPECGESFKIMKFFQMHMHKIHRKSNWKANQTKLDVSSCSKQHGVRPMTAKTSGQDNCPRCLCGSAFSTAERLQKHIQRMMPSDPLK